MDKSSDFLLKTRWYRDEKGSKYMFNFLAMNAGVHEQCLILNFDRPM